MTGAAQDANAPASHIPAATRKLSQAREDLLEHGMCLIADALPKETLRRAREAIYCSAAEDRAQPRGSRFPLDLDNGNRRVWNLLNRDPVFIEAFYTTPIYRPQENWFLSLSADVVRNASDTLLTLLAYRSEGFGLVYGRSPHESLDQERE